MSPDIHIVPTSDPHGKAASKSRTELTLLVRTCLRFRAILSTGQLHPSITGLRVWPKEIQMNKKNLLLSGVVVFIAYQVLDFVTHEVLMRSDYDATAQVWRPQEEMMSFMWIFIVVNLLWSFIFVYLFDQMNKGQWNSGRNQVRFLYRSLRCHSYGVQHICGITPSPLDGTRVVRVRNDQGDGLRGGPVTGSQAGSSCVLTPRFSDTLAHSWHSQAGEGCLATISRSGPCP